ncbi:E3 ubiquitin-protein ligase DZIP3-like isoform X2 [Mytilus californianus]|uniref:E3 ubiquitin-protein ligase DZIP3-like isoform X2 n=1 Tax=Mytilus californianus TaxID=6549 RepID=UPI0022452AEC|nr:E3 ubiquitin-protein ligase DZIP3-like isoform X2 [Mytilus californianus]
MTSMPKLKEEEKNFTRFFFLNFKVSPEIARRFFDGVFPPTSLAKTINNSVPAIINLYNRKRINAVQLDILRGIPGTKWSPHRPAMPLGTTATSSKDFDLTMLICLLRNLGGLSKPSNGWDQLPHPNDTLPGADLATLKWFRNQFAHTTVTSMDKNEFTDKWKLVEKALTSLNKGQRPYEVTEILNYDLDGEQAKTLSNTELKKLKKECIDCEMEIKQIEIDFSYYREGNIPKNIAGLFQFYQKNQFKVRSSTHFMFVISH